MNYNEFARCPTPGMRVSPHCNYKNTLCSHESMPPSSGSRGGLRGLKTPLGHEGGVLDPPVSVANITVKEHEGETEISPLPGQVRQPAFIPRRCRIKSHD